MILILSYHLGMIPVILNSSLILLHSAIKKLLINFHARFREELNAAAGSSFGLKIDGAQGMTFLGAKFSLAHANGTGGHLNLFVITDKADGLLQG